MLPKIPDGSCLFTCGLHHGRVNRVRVATIFRARILPAVPALVWAVLAWAVLAWVVPVESQNDIRYVGGRYCTCMFVGDRHADLTVYLVEYHARRVQRLASVWPSDFYTLSLPNIPLHPTQCQSKHLLLRIRWPHFKRWSRTGLQHLVIWHHHKLLHFSPTSSSTRELPGLVHMHCILFLKKRKTRKKDHRPKDNASNHLNARPATRNTKTTSRYYATGEDANHTAPNQTFRRNPIHVMSAGRSSADWMFYVVMSRQRIGGNKGGGRKGQKAPRKAHQETRLSHRVYTARRHAPALTNRFYLPSSIAPSSPQMPPRTRRLTTLSVLAQQQAMIRW